MLYEGGFSLARTMTLQYAAQPDAADLDGNGLVDPADLSILAQQWLDASAPPADFDNQPPVDLADYATFTRSWRQKAIWLNQ